MANEDLLRGLELPKRWQCDESERPPWSSLGDESVPRKSRPPVVQIDAPRNNRHHHGLFDLPAELRYLIYSLLLNVGIVYPYAKYVDPGINVPCVALLRTCKTVNTEASHAMFWNTYSFSTAEALEKFLIYHFSDGARRLRLTTIQIGLKWTGLDEQGAQAMTDEAYKRRFEEDIDNPSDNPEPSSLIRHVHEVRKIYMRDLSWQRMMNLVLDNLRPKTLILDLYGSLDLSECCKMQTSAICSMWPGFASGLTPEILKLKGLHGFEEIDEMSAGEQLVLTLVKIWTFARAGDAAHIPQAWIDEVGDKAEDNLLEEIQQEEVYNGGFF